MPPVCTGYPRPLKILHRKSLKFLIFSLGKGIPSQASSFYFSIQRRSRYIAVFYPGKTLSLFWRLAYCPIWESRVAISVKYPMILGRFRNGLLFLPLYLRKPTFSPHRAYPTWFLFFSSIVTPEKTGPLCRLRNTAPESHKPFNLQCLEDQRTKSPLLFDPLKLKAWNILFFCHICFFTI